MNEVQGILSMILSFVSIIGIGITIGMFRQKTNELEKRTEQMASDIRNISEKSHTNVLTFFERYNEVSISMAKVSEQIATISEAIEEIKKLIKEKE